MLHVKTCKYVDGFKLQLSFDNNTQGIADLQGVIKPDNVFAPLQDIAKFKNITLRYGGVVTWLDGQLDIAPEYLFFLANKDDAQYTELFIEWGYIKE